MNVETWSSLILEVSKGKTLPALLTALVDLSDMRRIAIDKGVGAKGFRTEKATQSQLAPLLAKEAPRNDGLREELAKALAEVGPAGNRKGKPAPAAARAEDSAASKALELRLRKAEKKALREAESAKKARASRQKCLARQAALEGETAELRRELARLDKECETWRQRAQAVTSDGPAGDPKLVEESKREQLGYEERIRDLEELDRRHRIAEAEHLSRIREYELQVQELESLLPRGHKERLKKSRVSHAPPSDAPALIPVYGREFLDALEKISESDQHRIHTTLAQIVLAGLEQPGLRVKTLKGRGGLLSVRAGIHYRIYFTRSGERLILHHVGTREEQETFLKKWKA